MTDDAGASPAPAPPPPSRPTIFVPPRSYYESHFASPGPMTLVSSFFAEDPDADCRSFSQLLAGAMASPAAAPPREAEAEKTDSGGGRGGGGGGMIRQSRPLGLMVAPSPFFTVPTGLSPTSLLDSPLGFFSPGSGHFGVSHQQALAQVTAQAAQAHSCVHIQAENPSSLSVATVGSITQPSSSSIGNNMALLQQMPVQISDSNNTTLGYAEDSHCEQRSQPTALIADKPTDDGYNWRKYGQKQVKGSEYPRSYYRCTHPNCPVKKKVERSLDGHVIEIIYKGQHNHQQPAPKRGKQGDTSTSGSNGINGSLDFPSNSGVGSQGGVGNISRSGDIAPISKRERDSGHGTSVQLSDSSDGEEVGTLGADEGNDTVSDSKRRNIDNRAAESASSHRTVTESRIIVQTTSEVDLLDDGYKWRKYGQKVVKGNPYPRSYYKCTYAGCNVRKHVERASTDPKDVITTYEGKHNHDVPAARKSSHNMAGAVVANRLQPIVHTTTPYNQPFLERKDLRHNTVQPLSVFQLKEEQS